MYVRKLKKLMASVLCVAMVSMLCACKAEEAVAVAISKELVTNLNPVSAVHKGATEVVEKLQGDYEYWYPHMVNDTDRKLWDMTVNKGDGCVYDDFIYNTQLCNPVDFGYELGFPLVDFVEEKVTEQNVLFTLSGLTLGEWSDIEDGTRVKYDDYRSTSYVMTDLEGYQWYFIVLNYTLTTDTEPETRYFNILGLSEHMGDWLTLELTGNYTVDDPNKEVYVDILREFAELYGFVEVWGTRSADHIAQYLMGEVDNDNTVDAKKVAETTFVD